jgi:uncharacterized membrane protein YqjE
MIEMHPRTMILLGFVLVLFGFVAPLLMVIRVIEPSFALSFLSHGASFVGLLLGMIGAVSYVRSSRH